MIPRQTAVKPTGLDEVYIESSLPNAKYVHSAQRLFANQLMMNMHGFHLSRVQTGTRASILDSTDNTLTTALL